MSVSPSRFAKIINKHYENALKKEDENIMFRMDDKDIRVWYALIHGLLGDNDELQGGEYLVKIVLPDTYPHSPPRFFFLTPNGVVDNEATDVCIHIGHHHSNNYATTMGVYGFVSNLRSVLLGWRDMSATVGMGIKNNIQEDDMRLHAQQSAEYNRNHLAGIRALFD